MDQKIPKVSIPSQVGILLVGRTSKSRSATKTVSIPSQVGILLVVFRVILEPEGIEVSIPSQVGILLVGYSHCDVNDCAGGLNTLSGGHPLGGGDPKYHG